MKEVVCFFLKGREFGVDVSQMKTIANETKLIPRDGLPEYVKGIVDIHGEQVPLLDYEQLFTIPDNQKRNELRYVVFNVTCGSFAIECDGISEIVSVEDSSVQGMPGFFNQDETNYADCMIQKKDKQLVLVMNPNRMLTKEQAQEVKKIIDELEEERKEAERKRIEEERRRKEEEKRQREEELARMREENGDSEKPSDTPDQAQEENNE